MAKFYCTGCSPLLFGLCSGVLPRDTVVHYIQLENTWVGKGYSKNSIQGTRLARELCEIFGVRFELSPVIQWYSPPTGRPRICEDLSLDYFDFFGKTFVSSNLCFLVNKKSLFSNAEIFPEGASCFSIFKRLKYGKFLFYSNLILRFLLKKAIGNHQISWLLPGKSIDESKILFLRSLGFPTFKKHLFFANVSMVRDFLTKRGFYHFFDSPVIKYYHPAIDRLNKKDYLIWAEEFCQIIQPEAKIIFKRRRRDAKSYKFLSERFEMIASNYTYIPAELFAWEQRNIRYIGYYSTTILGFKVEDIALVAPPDNETKVYYDKSYLGLSLWLQVFGRHDFES